MHAVTFLYEVTERNSHFRRHFALLNELLSDDLEMVIIEIYPNEMKTLTYAKNTQAYF